MGDWDRNTVIGLGKEVSRTKNERHINAARRSGAAVETKRVMSGGNKGHQGTDPQRIARLAREDAPPPPPKIEPCVGRAIQDARLALKLSQKKLAQIINEKLSVVQDYESNKAIRHPQILIKFERALGIKLRGSDIGKKLEGPKNT